MHQNYRRKYVYNKEESRHGFVLTWHRAHEARVRRRAVRRLIFREQYDLIPAKYPRDLLYYLL